MLIDPNLNKKIRLALNIVGTTILDSFLITFWIIIQYLAGIFCDSFPPEGLDIWIYYIFRFLLGISTLSPVAYYVFQDVTVIIRKVREQIKGLNDSNFYQINHNKLRGDLFVDRRTGKDRRVTYDLNYFDDGGRERRRCDRRKLSTVH